MKTSTSALIRSLTVAAGPGLAVLLLHAMAAEVFGHEPHVDPLMHLLGGAAAGFFFYRMGCSEPRFFGSLSPIGLAAVSLGLTTVVALNWEFAEFLSDIYLGTHTHTSISSTLRDLLNGQIGCIVFLIIQFTSGTNREKRIT